MRLGNEVFEHSRTEGQNIGLYETLLKALDAMGEGFVITTRGERVFYANDVFCRISGYSVEKLARLSSFFEIMPPKKGTEYRGTEYRGTEYRRLRECLAGQRAENRIETIVFHKSGRRADLEAGIEQLRIPDRPQPGAVVRDITGRERSE